MGFCKLLVDRPKGLFVSKRRVGFNNKSLGQGIFFSMINSFFEKHDSFFQKHDVVSRFCAEFSENTTHIFKNSTCFSDYALSYSKTRLIFPKARRISDKQGRFWRKGPRLLVHLYTGTAVKCASSGYCLN